MRTYLVLVAVLIIGTCTAQSLPDGATERVFVMKNDGIMGSMMLDTAQVSELMAVEADYQIEYDAILENDTLEVVEVRSGLVALNERRRARIEELLNAAQYAQWSQLVRGGTVTDAP